MKRNLIALLVATAAIGVSAPVVAVTPVSSTTVNIGDLYGLNGTDAYVDTRSYKATGGGSIANTYNFALSQNSVVHVSLTDQARLTGLTAALYQVIPGGDLLLTTLGALGGTAETASWQSQTPMAAGNYRVEVAGNYATRGSYGLELSSDVAAPVPGPAGFVVVGEQPAHGDERVTRPGDDIEDHRGRDGELRAQHLRGRLDQALLGLLRPGHESLGRLLAFDPLALLLVVTGLLQPPDVLDLVLRRLDDHGARGVEAGPPGPPGDLVELPRLQVPGALAVVLGQRGRGPPCGSGR